MARGINTLIIIKTCISGHRNNTVLQQSQILTHPFSWGVESFLISNFHLTQISFIPGPLD